MTITGMMDFKTNYYKLSLLYLLKNTQKPLQNDINFAHAL